MRKIIFTLLFIVLFIGWCSFNKKDQTNVSSTNNRLTKNVLGNKNLSGNNYDKKIKKLLNETKKLVQQWKVKIMKVKKTNYFVYTWECIITSVKKAKNNRYEVIYSFSWVNKWVVKYYLTWQKLLVLTPDLKFKNPSLSFLKKYNIRKWKRFKCWNFIWEKDIWNHKIVFFNISLSEWKLNNQAVDTVWNPFYK